MYLFKHTPSHTVLAVSTITQMTHKHPVFEYQIFSKKYAEKSCKHFVHRLRHGHYAPKKTTCGAGLRQLCFRFEISVQNLSTTIFSKTCTEHVHNLSHTVPYIVWWGDLYGLKENEGKSRDLSGGLNFHDFFSRRAVQVFQSLVNHFWTERNTNKSWKLGTHKQVNCNRQIGRIEFAESSSAWISLPKIGPATEEGTGVASDVVKVEGEDPATPGPLP